MFSEMFVPLVGSLDPVASSATASVAATATSSGLSFGSTVVFGVVLGGLFLLVLVRAAAAVLPLLVRVFVVFGSAVLVAGVLGSVLLLLQNVYQAVHPR